MRRSSALSILVCSVGLISAHAQEAPTLRLPEVAAPKSYKADLSLDPTKPTFSGNISIQLTIKQSVDMAFEFMKAHFDELAAKRPTGGGFDAGATFPQVGDGFCSAERRQALQDFLRPRVDKFTGAPRALSHVLESIDDCIAVKAAEEPSVVEFLKQYLPAKLRA